MVFADGYGDNPAFPSGLQGVQYTQGKDIINIVAQVCV
jgi:hypothetical protein